MTAMTGSLAALAFAAFAFVASHLALPVPAVRRRLTAALGENGYLVFYSALSLLLYRLRVFPQLFAFLERLHQLETA